MAREVEVEPSEGMNSEGSTACVFEVTVDGEGGGTMGTHAKNLDND